MIIAKFHCSEHRPKKAVEGLLRHLQKKWEKVTAQLGSGYELHLVGLLSGQQDTCLSWRSQGISTLLSVCSPTATCAAAEVLLLALLSGPDWNDWVQQANNFVIATVMCYMHAV